MKQILALLFLATFALCQVRDAKIKPQSMLNPVSKNIHLIVLPKVNVPKQLEEESKETGLAPRYGFAHKVSTTLNNAGTFETLKDGSRLWRVSFRAPGAFFTVINFEKFVLKAGATVHIIEKSGAYKGAYTHKNNKEHKGLAVGPIKGDEFTIELHEPAKLVGSSKLALKTITHAYKDLFGYKEKNGRSGTCNIETACKQGDNVRDQIKSSGLLLQSSGFRFCSGALVNNLAGDGTPHFLTAAHCGSSPSGWIVMFNYESEKCGQRNARNTEDTISALKSVTRQTVSDMHLLSFTGAIPSEYNVYLSGWSAVDEAEKNLSYAIHHPSGDNKKIALCNTALTNSRWGSGPLNTHWRVNRWSEGTTEPGSSGSPLYDSNKRIIGQLHGGTASCRNPNGWDVYGKVARSYADSKAFVAALDPKDTGKKTCDGAYLNALRKFYIQ